MLRNLDRYFLLLSIFLIRFPPIYILGFQHVAATSHVVATVILILLLLRYIPKIYKSNILKLNSELLLILFFFITQAISVLSIINTSAYVNRLSKILIGLILFIIVRYIISKDRKNKFIHSILLVLVFGSIITLILQLFLYISPQGYAFFSQIVIYQNVLEITQTNYFVGKLFDDTYIEIIIPIVFYYTFLSSQLYKKVLFSFLFISLGILSFISNFRYRLVAFIFASVSSTIFFKRFINNISLITLTIITPVIVFFFLDSFILNTNNYTIVDRFLLGDQADVNSISWRIEMYYESITMAKNNFFGVGLGNFYDNLPHNNPLFTSKITKDISHGALTSGSHNIFFHTLAESGFIGLFSLILLLGYFFLKDITILKSNNIQVGSVIISFWTLIIIAQFFPAINLTFYFLFFLLRALI